MVNELPHAGLVPVNVTSCEANNQSKLPNLLDPSVNLVNLQFVKFGAKPYTQIYLNFVTRYTRKYISHRDWLLL